MKLRLLLSALTAPMLIAAQPALAADAQFAPPAPGSLVASALPNAEVDAFMAQRRGAPVWFRAGGGAEAVSALAQILRRAPLDGMPNGPALAGLVEAAGRDAASGNPAAVDAADRTLSAVWLAYVAALKAPLQSFTFVDLTLTPRVPSSVVTLQRAATAPSLAEHLMAVSNVNGIYADIRSAAWASMQRSGRSMPDSRTLLNLARARIFPSTGKFLVVNSATQELLIAEDGKVVDRMKVIVGRPDAQTPMLASMIWYATLNPYWYVPMDLTQNIVAKKMQSPIAKAYWAEKHYEIMSDFGPNPTVLPPSSIDWKAVQSGAQTVYLRQLPGPGNSMGKIKFRFPNEIGVYLHDTDLPVLFGQPQRTLSNGCIRLEDAMRLGRWLLGRDPATLVNGDKPEQHVQLPRGVPVYLTYLTAQPRGSELTFVKDVYGRDGSGPTGSVMKSIASN